MASDGNSGGGSGSWPGFLAELTKSFLILRDVFGYALPGAVFLAIGVLTRRFSLGDVKALFQPYQPPLWLSAVLAIGACYVIGHLLSGIAYFPFNTWRWRFWRRPDPDANHGLTNLPSALIAIRAQHPEVLTELERQSTMAQLRGSTGAAMVLGYLIFYQFPTPPIGWMFGIAGLFLLFVFMFSATAHIEKLTLRTIQAADTVSAAEKPAGSVDSEILKQALSQFILTAQEALKKL